MTITMVTIALMVLFAALLIGKMLTEMLGGDTGGADRRDSARESTPAE
jgi:hypothetical protein